MIAGAEGIAFGIKEDQHAFLLIIVEEREKDRQRRKPRHRGTAEPPERQAGDEHHHDPADADRERGAEIGLQHDERGRQPDHHQRGPQRGEGARIARRKLRIEARERDDDRDLHQLRRLEVHETEVEPSLAAPADETKQLDRDQQDQDADIGDIGEVLEDTDREAADHQRDTEEDEEAHALVERPRRPVAACRRIEDEQAETGDPGENRDQFPRDALDGGWNRDHCASSGSGFDAPAFHAA